MDFRALLLIILILAVTSLASERSHRFPFRLAVDALLLEALLAQLLKLPYLEFPVRAIARAGVELMSFASAGIAVVFGRLATPDDPTMTIFAVSVLPVVIYFSALMSAAFYLGIVQRVTRLCATLMRLAFSERLTGSEALVAAANLFVGQVEAPLCVAPQIPRMTRSQLMTMMACGFATMSATVSVFYALMLSGNDGAAASTYLVIIMRATVLAIPAATLLGRILVPFADDDSVASEAPQVISATGLADAIVRGSRQGVQLAVNIGAMLIVFGALLALVNSAIGGIGNVVCSISHTTPCPYSTTTVQDLLGYALAPVAYLLGFPRTDALVAGRLLGIGIFATEFYGFRELLQSRASMTGEGFLLGIYALANFANLPSIGVQIGGLSGICPERRPDFIDLAPRAMLAGLLGSWMGAAIAGLAGLAV